MDYMKDYIKALREDKSYGWISCNAHELTRDELVNIIKELDYAIHDQLDEFDKTYVCEAAAEELESYYCEEE